jgi:serine/threonine-protein kinase
MQRTAIPNPGSIVAFLRKRDYVFVKVLGQGACGQTVLLRDEIIGSDFVCKKYLPFAESHRQELFRGFLREIKLLHEVYHTNVVRVFNYYVYPEQYTGFILMEYVAGKDIKSVTL